MSESSDLERIHEREIRKGEVAQELQNDDKAMVPSAKTFSENISVLTEYIFKAIDMAEPHAWHEWDSFAGRMDYKEQPLRDAQKESVRKFLTMVFENERAQS